MLTVFPRRGKQRKECFVLFATDDCELTGHKGVLDFLTAAL